MLAMMLANLFVRKYQMYKKETFILVVWCVYKFFFSKRKNILTFWKKVLDDKRIDFLHILRGAF
jgi:hypothetical protein